MATDKDEADITSLIHTFPFIVQNIREGEMVLDWNTSPFYWTGVAALVPQVRVRVPQRGFHSDIQSL